MKALILAGGKGTRLRPITFSMAKQLVPVANKPVVEYGLEAILDAGIREIGVIVGDTAQAVMAALGDGARWGCGLTYIPQDRPLGLAHAVATAKPFLGEDDFVMYLGDNLIKSSVRALVEAFERDRPAATILLTRVPNPQDFGVAEMQEGRVTRLQEKPSEPKSDFALVGVYLFSKAIHEAIAKLEPSDRGEYEITDAIQGLIDAGLDVRPTIVEGWWKDTGTVEAMLEANRLILEDIDRDVRGHVCPASSVEGRVRVASGAKIVRSVVRGPVVLGEGVVLEDAYVGPFTSIDANTVIRGAEIEHSIVLADCVIQGLDRRIEGSLIGRGARVVRGARVPKTLSFVLGDSSTVELP